MSTTTPPAHSAGRRVSKPGQVKRDSHFVDGIGRHLPHGFTLKTVSIQQWADWSKHLADRRTPRPLVKLIPRVSTSPLTWALPEDKRDSGELLDPLFALVRKNRKLVSEDIFDKITPWVAEAEERPADVMFAVECLAWCHALPRLATSADPQLWWRLLACLVKTATESAAISLDENPLSHQMLSGELPLTIAYLFPEIKLDGKPLQAARKSLSRGLVELLDGEGLPNCRHLSLLRPLLACWTRSLVMGSQMTKSAFSKDAMVQYEWLVLQSLRLTRSDGSSVFATCPSDDGCPEMMASVLAWSDDPDDARVAAAVLPGKVAAAKKKTSQKDLPEPSIHSEWAEMTVLRPNWLRKGPRLTLKYGGQNFAAELESGGDVLWSGCWLTQVRVASRLLEIEGDWEDICWFSDEDGDYLELEVSLSDGWTLQRQIYLARKDHFLYCADAILGEAIANIQYRSSLPLAPGVTFSPADETREGLLVTGSRTARCLCLPLALPEWRTDPRHGSLAATESGLELVQKAEARRLYAPWFIDLDTRRIQRRRTWRQLTVAEQLTVVPWDTAVGYRVQMNNAQWIFYRSLVPSLGRTVLGQNLTSECLIARFLPDGTITTLVEIE